jgi:hypothetical protein
MLSIKIFVLVVNENKSMTSANFKSNYLQCEGVDEIDFSRLVSCLRGFEWEIEGKF